MRRWHVIANLVHQRGLGVGAEIGVAEGRFSAALLDLCPDLKLWGFDNYLPGYRTWMGSEWSPDAVSKNKEMAQIVVRRYRPRFTLVEKSSVEAASWLDDASLDFVFIDADHSYDAVRADIKAWTPKLRDGGWMTGHDYDPERFPGVVRAVEERFPEFHLGDDFTWMAQA